MKEKGRRVRSQIQIFEYVILLTLMLQYLIEKENSRKKLLTSWCPENKGTRRVQEQVIPFKGRSPVTYFL
jgi:hypothetical protein